jgi:ACT domain-containing protein
VIFAGIGVLLLVRPLSIPPPSHTDITQAVKDVETSRSVLFDIFDRIENFFRRLETYAATPATAEMMDVIGKIMVEVLSILAIATKEIKQGRTSELTSTMHGF